MPTHSSLHDFPNRCPLGARKNIYILDWWLSPELYLRRPPSQNEQYRLDNLLKSAAERGVKVRVIVYREVSAALSLNSSVRNLPFEPLDDANRRPFPAYQENLRGFTSQHTRIPASGSYSNQLWCQGGTGQVLQKLEAAWSYQSIQKCNPVILRLTRWRRIILGASRETSRNRWERVLFGRPRPL